MVEDVRAAEFTFGVEIETVIPRNAGVTVGSYSAGSPVRGGNDKDTGEWIDAPTYRGKAFRCGSDSSIRANRGYRDAEFWTPILKANEGVEFTLAMADFIRRIGGKVNTSTGMHIHVGVASVIGQYADVDKTIRYVQKVSALANTYETAIYAQTGTRRDLNHYCRPWRSTEKDRVRRSRSRRGIDGVARHTLLNLMNVFYGKGTVEFRAFAGTLNDRKIMHHLGTALAIASRAAITKQARWTDARGMGASNVGGHGEKAVKGFWNAFNWILGASRVGWNQETGEAISFGLFGKLFEANKENRKKAREMARKFDERFNGTLGVA
jgi:hypothetical protein